MKIGVGVGFATGMALAALAGCAVQTMPPDPAAATQTCNGMLAQLDHALPPGMVPEATRTAFGTDCVTEQLAAQRKHAAQCKLEALESHQLLEFQPGLIPLMMAENRRAEIFKACMEIE